VSAESEASRRHLDRLYLEEAAKPQPLRGRRSLGALLGALLLGAECDKSAGRGSIVSSKARSPEARRQSPPSLAPPESSAAAPVGTEPLPLVVTGAELLRLAVSTCAERLPLAIATGAETELLQSHPLVNPLPPLVNLLVNRKRQHLLGWLGRYMGRHQRWRKSCWRRSHLRSPFRQQK
jgi:hypothetical protein